MDAEDVTPSRGCGLARSRKVAERRHHLLLAEHAYQKRFRGSHPVVANSVSVPRVVAPPGAERVSYLGSVTMSRGCDTMIKVGCEITPPTDRVSLPTKIVEYCALGVPVITTPLPLASELLKSEDVGFECAMG